MRKPSQDAARDGSDQTRTGWSRNLASSTIDELCETGNQVANERTSRRDKPVPVICDNCGRSFEKPPKRLRKFNYCCRLCKDTHGKLPVIEGICQTCEKAFVTPNHRSKTAKYCCNNCKFIGLSKSLECRRAEFWSYVDIRGPDDCWPWLSSLRSGYGRFWTTDGFVTAHVEAWEQTYGRVQVKRGTTGTVLRHSCDRRDCVNPRHLTPGTQAENIQDMVDRGRSTKGQNQGEKNAAAKLTVEQVKAIRSDERTQREIGADYGISRTMVRYIKQRKWWAHVD